MPSLYFGLPLIEAGQAQKHVTANEATEAAAIVAAAVVRSASDANPSGPSEGDAFVVPAGWVPVKGDGSTFAQGDIAFRLGGVWHGGPAPIGHRVFVADEARHRAYAGSGVWAAGSVFGPTTGAGLGFQVRDVFLDLSGPSTTAAGLIPPRAIVLGVTSWVVDAVTGAASFDVGDGTTVDRFGGTLGVGQGDTNVGVLGPFATYAATDVVVTANGSDFTGGRLGLAAAIVKPEPPQ